MLSYVKLILYINNIIRRIIQGRFGNVVSDNSYYLVAFFSFSFTRNKRERNEGTEFILKEYSLCSLFLFDCDAKRKSRTEKEKHA